LCKKIERQEEKNMENSNWKLIAIINTILTLACLIALVSITMYYKGMMEDVNNNESANTRVEFNYMTKIFDGVEFIYPKYGILRDTETNEDIVLDKFDVVEKIETEEGYDRYSIEVVGTNYGGENINIYFEEFDAEGNYVDEFFTQMQVTRGDRLETKAEIDIDKSVARIEIRLQESAELNFGE